MTGREVDVHVSDRPDIAPRRARASIRRRRRIRRHGAWEWRCAACSNDGVLWRSWPAHSHQDAVQAACEHLSRGLHFWVHGPISQPSPFGPSDVAGGMPPPPMAPIIAQHVRRMQVRWGS